MAVNKLQLSEELLERYYQLKESQKNIEEELHNLRNVTVEHFD